MRINAALALSAPSNREHYGTFFIPLWAALLQALDQSQTIEDLAEYKHRDQLVEQVPFCRLLRVFHPLVPDLLVFRAPGHPVADGRFVAAGEAAGACRRYAPNASAPSSGSTGSGEIQRFGGGHLRH